ncbi:UNVERIFIED_CONTAM: hypothetical protein ABIE34_000623 [Jeotgalibacillus campisalis]
MLSDIYACKFVRAVAHALPPGILNRKQRPQASTERGTIMIFDSIGFSRTIMTTSGNEVS